jgi:hypothetical protein
LWDGLCFDRSDWVEEALVRGVSPDFRDKNNVPALYVAAYLNRTRAVELLVLAGAAFPNTDKPFQMAPYAHLMHGADLSGAIDALFCAMLHNNIPMYRALMSAAAPWEKDYDNLKIRAWSYLSETVFRTGKADIFVELATEQAVAQLGWADKPEPEIENLRRALRGLAPCLTGYENAIKFKPAETKLPQAGEVRAPDHPTIKRIYVDAEGAEFGKGLPDDAEHIFVDIETGGDASYYIVRARIADTVLIEGSEYHRVDKHDSYLNADFFIFYCDDKADMDRFVASRTDVKLLAKFLEAADADDIDTVHECLAQGINPDLSAWTFDNAASHAFLVGNVDLLEAWLNYSGDLREYFQKLEAYGTPSEPLVAYVVRRLRDGYVVDDMACYLIRNGYDIHAPDRDGFTPLQRAITGNRKAPTQVIQALLEAGADDDFLKGGELEIRGEKIAADALQAIQAWRAKKAIGRVLEQARTQYQLSA